MKKLKFEKPSLSISDQIALLKRRGLIVGDEKSAEHYLRFISYYRLRACWLPFEGPAENDGDHAFHAETRFEDVLKIYTFDRELRLLVLDAIERVEIALRAQWAHHMAMTYGPHGYLEQKLYAQIARHAKALKQLKREFKRSRDMFAIHYRKKYTSPEFPPVWMAAEVMSFGLLSKFYDDLKLCRDRQVIAKPFGLDEKVVRSFAHHISHVRNICAHHGRLWNKKFTVTIEIPKYPKELSVAMCDSDKRYLHNSLVMISHFLSVIAPDNTWKADVIKLIDDCPLADPVSMGCPEGWRERPAWKIN